MSPGTYPYELLDAYIRTFTGDDLPPESEIERLIEIQEREATKTVFNLYLLPWAQAMAAHVEAARGNHERASEYASRARNHHPDAPYLSVILDGGR